MDERRGTDGGEGGTGEGGREWAGTSSMNKIVTRYQGIPAVTCNVGVPAGRQFGNSIPPRNKKYPPPYSCFQGSVGY